jgi:hypothetical protein
MSTSIDYRDVGSPNAEIEATIDPFLRKVIIKMQEKEPGRRPPERFLSD